jgi:hypothetical protein
MVMVDARFSVLDARCALCHFDRKPALSGVEWVKKMPFGDPGGWTAGRDHDPGESDEMGERFGRARVKSLTIVRLNNERCLHSGRHDKKPATGNGNSLCLIWRGANLAGVDARGR